MDTGNKTILSPLACDLLLTGLTVALFVAAAWIAGPERAVACFGLALVTIAVFVVIRVLRALYREL